MIKAPGLDSNSLPAGILLESTTAMDDQQYKLINQKTKPKKFPHGTGSFLIFFPGARLLA